MCRMKMDTVWRKIFEKHIFLQIDLPQDLMKIIFVDQEVQP